LIVIGRAAITRRRRDRHIAGRGVADEPDIATADQGLFEAVRSGLCRLLAAHASARYAFL
jgi:hypothetical protein